MSWPEIDGLERHPAFAVAGLARRIPEGDAAAVGRLWQDLDTAALAAAVSERASDRPFTLFTQPEGPADGERTVLAVVGLAVPAGAAVAGPFETHAAPAGTYALVPAEGPMPGALAEVWAAILASDLPRGGGADFEIHGQAPTGIGAPAARTVVHVAIDPAAFARPPLAARLAAVARAGVVRRLTFDANGLIPAVAQQHDTGEVLMVAWMNREAVEETLATRQVTYWSRSRQQRWRKGETSGHRQRLVDLRPDCDGDTLLLLVDQTGPACHTGERTCFFLSAGSGVVSAVGDADRPD